MMLRTIAVATMLLASPAWAIDKCKGSHRVTCVVDGDTFWIDGVKYRTRGYDTPEPRTNICGGRAEQRLAAKATARFIELFNTTEVTITAIGGKGYHGRDLVDVLFDGRNAGSLLISEGLARQWPDGQEFWCN